LENLVAGLRIGFGGRELALGALKRQPRRGALAVQELLAFAHPACPIQLRARADSIGRGPTRGFQAGVGQFGFQTVQPRGRAIGFSFRFFVGRLQSRVADPRQQLAFEHLITDLDEELLHGALHRRAYQRDVLRLNLAAERNRAGQGRNGLRLFRRTRFLQRALMLPDEKRSRRRGRQQYRQGDQEPFAAHASIITAARARSATLERW
jgi:hypothetical protein